MGGLPERRQPSHTPGMSDRDMGMGAEPSAATADTLLRVENLHVSFATDTANIQAVEGLSLSLKAGEIVALVGESG